jgi:predicted ATPase
MNKIIMENLRCFGGLHEVDLKPLTLLAGENSTGKTTFLAAIKIASELAAQNLEPDFNEEPFLLGAYDQIAHFRGGKAGRSQTFTIGYGSSGSGTSDPTVRMTATFQRSGSQPVISEWSVKSGKRRISAAPAPEGKKWTISLETSKKKMNRTFTSRDSPGAMWLSGIPAPRFAFDFMLFRTIDKSKEGKEIVAEFTEAELRELRTIVSRTYRRGPRSGVRAFAPIRSKPQRTYDPTRETPEPTGSHVPMVLARVYGSDTNKWKDLVKGLEEFGRGSGLFESISIKRLGHGGSDPFQLLFKTGGQAANLLDVGYGVSQSLPILVDTLLEDRRTIFLMQQPEVHLHPRAQAQLGTFFGKMAKAYRHKFVIETHSDYLVDRVRMDVRDGVALSPDDVSILYFEKKGPSVTIHPIGIDSYGNITDAPPGYRDFFLQEEGRFFGIRPCA